MQTCLVVINKQCGNYARFDADRLAKALPNAYRLHFAQIEDDYIADVRAHRYDALALLGGDGTLHNFINQTKGVDIPLYYFPLGTLNERARIGQTDACLGYINDETFVYVAACGSFTPIGYDTDVRLKKRWKALAYVWQALREYRVYDIPAVVSWDQHKEHGNYSLIMALKSPRCFLFRFNKLYDPQADNLHLLLVPTTGKDNLWGRVRLFFPLFRAFFLGFRREVHGKNLQFVQCHRVVLHFPTPVAMNVDGEKRTLRGTYRLGAYHTTPAITVCALPKK